MILPYEIPLSEQEALTLAHMNDCQKIALAQWLLEQVRYKWRKPILKPRNGNNQPQRVEGGQWSHS